MAGKASHFIEHLIVLTLSASLGLTSHSWAQGIASELPDRVNRPAKPTASPVFVPYLFGRSRTDASALALAAGLKPVFFGSTAAGADVTSQSPNAGTRVQTGTFIRLQMAVSAARVSVPDLFGRNRTDASALALAAGLKPVFFGSTAAGADVTSQSPNAGMQVQTGTFIRLQMAVSAQASHRR